VEDVGGAEIASKVGVHVRSASYFVLIGCPKSNSRMEAQAGKATHVNSLLGLLSKSLETVYQHTWI
jgi:phosphotransferase system HPr-like phosphotransfer protein